MSENEAIDPMLLESAKQLVEALEKEDQEAAEQCLAQLTHLHESALFNELGKLTREFHEAINSFRYDVRFTELTEDEIPDAKERLNYVITRTEEAANKTLGAVENSLPLVEDLTEKSTSLLNEWKTFKRKEMSADQFRQLIRQIDEFLSGLKDSSGVMKSDLTEVLMAQDFQDITGQIIRRVINLVDEVEQNLVSLIKLGYKGEVAKEGGAKESKEGELEGPKVPGLETNDMVSGQDEVDDLLSSLGF